MESGGTIESCCLKNYLTEEEKIEVLFKSEEKGTIM